MSSWFILLMMSSIYTGLINIEEQTEDMDFIEFDELGFGSTCAKLEPTLEKYLLKHNDMCLQSLWKLYNKLAFLIFYLLFSKFPSCCFCSIASDVENSFALIVI